MPSKRLHDWDALRGIMMLLGIVLHAGLSFVDYPVLDFWPYKFSKTNIFFDFIVTVIHLYRVPVFFIIAGFFMTKQLDKYGQKKAIVKRIKRILVPFVVAMLFITPWVIYAFATLMQGLDEITFVGVLDYWRLSLHYTVHFWFLYYLMFFYLVHLLYWNLLKRYVGKISVHPEIVPLILLAQVLVLFFWGNDSIHASYSFLPPLGSVLYYFGYYTIGIWVSDNLAIFESRIQLSRSRIIKYYGIVSVYLLVRLFESFFRPQVFGILLEAILTVGVSVSLILFTFGLFKILFAQEKKWVKQMAQSAYFVYLIHLPIVLWLVIFLKDWFENPFAFFFVVVMATTALSFTLYFAKAYLWEKIGWKK